MNLLSTMSDAQVERACAQLGVTKEEINTDKFQVALQMSATEFGVSVYSVLYRPTPGMYYSFLKHYKEANEES